MPAVDFVVRSEVSTSLRAEQVSAMYDVPPAKKASRRWKGNVPIEEKDWSVGLIVGPSGAGKSSVARQMFGDHYHPEFTWDAKSLIDDFNPELSCEAITQALGSVGFNTIPSWLRPFRTLSTGEMFRSDVARRLLECESPIVVDEFTSVVDRQVAKIGSHAIQKFVRKRERMRFVAVGCHYDVVDWLQPDWLLEPATMAFSWRSVQPRPQLTIEVRRVPYRYWKLFAPFHYLTAALSAAARCYCAFINDKPVAFAGLLHFPHPKVRDIKRFSRVVCLPDWQGLGIAPLLTDVVASAYKSGGWRVRAYPSHPNYVRVYVQSDVWKMTKRPGYHSPKSGRSSSMKDANKGRACAVFAYTGPAMADSDQAERLIGAG